MLRLTTHSKGFSGKRIDILEINGREMSIRTKFIAMALVAVVFASALLVAISLFKGGKLIEAAIETEVSDSQRQVLSRLEGASRDALRQATVIASMPRVGMALARQDVDPLIDEFVPGFGRLSEENGAGTFIFVVPPSINFLRVQNPENRLDDVGSFRPELTTAMQEQKPLHGLARGRAGLSARGMAPVFHDGELVGLAEIGASLNEDFFNSILETTGRNTEFYLLPSDIATFDGTESQIVRSTATLDTDRLLSDDDIKSAIANSDLRREVSIDGRNYVSTAFPINGLNGDPVAVINILTDVTKYGLIQVRALWMSALALVLSLTVGGGIAVWSGNRLGARIHALSTNMMDLAGGNLDINIELADNQHEIGKMTKAMAVFLENARTARDLDLEVREKERHEREREAADRAREAEHEKERRALETRERNAERARMQILEDFQKDMERVLGKAASGDFSDRMSNDIDDQALVGLADVINQLLEDTESNINDIVNSIGELSRGNLGIRMEGDRQGVFLRMKDDFNAGLTTLSTTMADILDSGQNVSATSSHLEKSSNEMAKRAEHNAAAIEETSTAVAQITASIRQVVANAKSADEATRKVRESADKTRAVSNETEASIGAMTEASEQINRVVKVIEDIAFQINLLALNAGVEAARAGEAGRGFSVVASEVRALAQRSQEAVQEISQVIEQNNQSVELGVEKVALSRKALEDIISDIAVASDQISEIARAVEQQSVGIEEVNATVTSIDKSAQTNAAALEEMTAASVSMNAEATTLAKALTHFHGVSHAKAPDANAKVLSMHAEPGGPKHQLKKVAAVAGGQAVASQGWEEF